MTAALISLIADTSEEGASFLVTPSVGLIVWTVVAVVIVGAMLYAVLLWALRRNA